MSEEGEMTVTSEQVKAALDREDYDKAAELGVDALPHLLRFVEGGDPSLAPKATYLAGRIGGPQGAAILELAAASDEAVIRVAAAGGASHLPGEDIDAVLQTLVDDDDPSVRKVALRSVRADASVDLTAKVEVLREHEPELEGADQGHMSACRSEQPRSSTSITAVTWPHPSRGKPTSST